MITIGGVAIYAVGMRIPLPTVDRQTVLEYLARNPEGLHASYDLFTGGALSTPTVFTFGITPYILAAVLVVLFSGVVPSLRRLRDGEAQDNQIFDRWIYALTAAVALVQSWGLAVFLHDVQSESGMPAGGLAGRVAITAAAMAGTMLLVWIAHQLSGYGLANGIVLLLFVDLLVNLVSSGMTGLSLQARAVASGIQTPKVPVLLLLGVVLTAASVVAVRSKRPLTLVQSRPDPDSSDPPAPDLHLGIRINSAGIIPLWTANLLIAPLHRLGIGPERITYWVLYCAATIGFAYLWTAVTFSSTDFIDRIKSRGYRLAQTNSAKEAVARVDAIVERAILPYALFLAALAASPALLYDGLNVNWQLASVLGPSLLTAAAMAVAILEGSRALLKMEGSVTSAADHAGWAAVVRGETELDVEIVRAVLDRAGIPCVRFANRAISVTGTLAFWESARPSLPSLTIYRRLGGGEADALVPMERVDEAMRVLRTRRVVSMGNA